MDKHEDIRSMWRREVKDTITLLNDCPNSQIIKSLYAFCQASKEEKRVIAKLADLSKPNTYVIFFVYVCIDTE